MSNRSSTRRRIHGGRVEDSGARREALPHLVLVPSDFAPTAPAPPPATAAAFAARLKAARERRGITLHAIAEATKISPALLATLERGDISRWPGGIYRRAFFSAYVQAVGLPLEPAAAEFLRLFPERETPTVSVAGAAPPVEEIHEGPGRIELAGNPRLPAERVRALFVEAAVVSAVALAAAPAADGGAWSAAMLATAWFCRPAVTTLARRARRLRRWKGRRQGDAKKARAQREAR